MKKVLITGASGMVGKGVLLECLDHKNISKVVTIGRSLSGVDHPKLKGIIHGDFNNYDDIKENLKDIDACFFCMGISAAGMKENDYNTITYDFTINLAKVLFELNSNMVFNYVSGQGTDSSEKGRVMWARVKGKTENRLLNYGFKDTYMFRPGAIIPLRGIKSKTRAYQFVYDYFMWLIKLIKLLAPNTVVNTTQIGEAMINSVLIGYPKKLLKPADIIKLSEK